MVASPAIGVGMMAGGLQDFSAAWLGLMALALVSTGVVAGVLAGMLGVGGGIVIVPVLYHVFTLMGVDESVRMHVAVGTSLATIVPTSIMSARAHRLRGSLNPAILGRLVPPVVLGVLIGAVVSGYVSGHVLTAVFATVALLVALNMAIKREGASLRDGLPGRVGTSLLGVFIGGLSTLMGIGGGLAHAHACGRRHRRGTGHGDQSARSDCIPGQRNRHSQSLADHRGLYRLAGHGPHCPGDDADHPMGCATGPRHRRSAAAAPVRAVFGADVDPHVLWSDDGSMTQSTVKAHV
jgi:hypothetical protein